MNGERCDVAVLGAGLVGLALAYELSCLGATVTVIDAGHPGRATDAGAGILSPVTSAETDAALWPFLRQAGTHYPALLARLAADGADVSAAGYGACGILSVGLRPHEDGWFSPFADLVLQRSPGEVAEIPADEATALFPPLGPVHRALHAPGSARVDGRGMAAALRRAAEARGIAFVEGTAHGLVSRGIARAAGRVGPRGGSGQRRLHRPGGGGRGVDGGRGGVARPGPPGRPDEGPDRASRASRPRPGAGPSCSRC